METTSLDFVLLHQGYNLSLPSFLRATSIAVKLRNNHDCVWEKEPKFGGADIAAIVASHGVQAVGAQIAVGIYVPLVTVMRLTAIADAVGCWKLTVSLGAMLKLCQLADWLMLPAPETSCPSWIRHWVQTMNNSAWQKARKRVGLTEVRIHDLKHTFGRRLRAASVSFEDRQDLLGHKSSRITDHYSSAELSNLIAAAEKVCVSQTRKSHATI